MQGDKRFTTGGGLLARLFAPGFATVLDLIDRTLECAGIDATIPCSRGSIR